MYIDKITKFCDKKYDFSQSGCCDCENDCQKDCEKCLCSIFFYGDNRRYNCSNIINYYVCKYIYKYSSEIEVLINNIKPLRKLQEYKIMSIGCGPCSDLFAFINYMEKNDVSKPLDYVGVDLNTQWKLIHEKIYEMLEDEEDINLRFLYKDIFKVIDKLKINENIWRPNILIFQYVVSDMVQHENPDEIKLFFKKVFEKIVTYMPPDSFIILNDINHNKKARDYFDYFEERMKKCYTNIKCYKYHFRNNNGSKTTYLYGTQHERNEITIDIPESLDDYSPWKFCTSAQLIIHKKE